ncbi:MAG: hypothetical protein LBR18_06305 [Tannerella sp.]|nr:hypothetical protein [Tannerella sp.]
MTAVRFDLENSFSTVKTCVEPLVNSHEFTFDALNLALGKGIAKKSVTIVTCAAIQVQFKQVRMNTTS